MRRSQISILVVFTLAAGGIVYLLRPNPVDRASGSLEQGAVVSTDEARTGLPTTRPVNLASLMYVGAEVSWPGNRAKVVRGTPDYPSLRNAHVPVGASLKVGAYEGSFDPAGAAARLVSDLARSTVDEARDSLINLREIQIEFDSPVARLDEYRMWVETVRRRVAPTPVTIMAMSDWVEARSFKSLMTAADGFILRVRPRDAAAMVDAATARRAVEAAGALGIPFRVALPGPGLAAIDAAGAAWGLAQSQVGAKAARHAALPQPFAFDFLKDFTANRPATLKGVLWYGQADVEREKR